MTDEVESLEPLTCYMCTFECFSQNELKTHFRIHSGFKPFMCTLCNATFYQKSSLEKHCPYFHGGRGLGQTSHIERKCGQSVGTGVQTGGIFGTNKEDVHFSSSSRVTVRKRGRPRKTEDVNIDQKFDNSTEEVICLSDQVTSAKVNKKSFVQSKERAEKSGMKKEDVHSGTTRRKRGRPRTNGNKTMHSKLNNSSEEVICLSDNVTTANVKGGQTNTLQCYICFKQFLWFDDLQAHLNIHTEEKPYVCPVCQCGFREWDALKTHSLIHSGKDEEVPEDEKTDKLQSGINLEDQNVSNSDIIVLPLKLSEKSTEDTPKSCVCNFCRTGFVDPKLLESHSKSHLTDKPWTCNHCHESFAVESMLQSHRKISHAGKDHYICYKCKKRFKFNCTLIKHLDVHTGVKPYTCNVCHKSFAWKMNLKVHTRIHTGERPFKCNLCDKDFTQKNHLVVHQISHTRKRRFKRNIRNKRLSVQQKTISENGKTRFMCSICNRKFNHKGRYQFHMKSHIGEKQTQLTFERSPSSVEEPSTLTKGVTLKPLEFENKMAASSEIIIDLGSPIDQESIQQHRRKINEPHGETAKKIIPRLMVNKNSTNLFHKSTTCNYCMTGFLDTKDLKIHLESFHTGENVWICNHCQKKFRNNAKLKSHHQISHTKERHWICDKCKKRFKISSVLKQHLLIHTGEKAFKCNICKGGFNHISNFKVQLRVHTGEKPYTCGYYHQRFKYRDQFRRHVQKCLPKTHESSEGSLDADENVKNEEGSSSEFSDEKSRPNKITSRLKKKRNSLICNYCKTGFTNTTTLELHSKAHIEENWWLCNTCPESFLNQHALKFHRRSSHGGEKYWICDECRKRFKTAGSLNQHLIIHTGKYPFKCNICDKGFNQKTNLRIHQRVHTGEKPYMCTFCNKRFKSANGFKKHGQRCKLKLGDCRTGVNSRIRPGSIIIDSEKQVDNKSSEPHLNKIIESQTLNKNSINPFHKSTICIYCKTGFLELGALKVHIESSHRGENPWTCNHCPKKFQNQIKLKFHHRISHTGGKHFICHKCKKRFKSVPELNRHLLVHTGDKPFECNICKKGFNQIINLRVHSRVHTGEKPYVCGFCHHPFKYKNEFKRHVQKCLPKTHESSEISSPDEENVETEEVCLNELVDEKCESEIQVAKNVDEFSNVGPEGNAPSISADSFTQEPGCSGSLSSSANTSTENNQDQLVRIGSEGKSSGAEQLEQSTDMDTTTCSKLSEENRSQEWTSFLKVFNVKVARKF